jgi:hypothetical protein
VLSDWLVWAAWTVGTTFVLFYLFFGWPFGWPNRKRKTRVLEPQDPWASWKRYQVEHRQNVAAEHKGWLDEAMAILQQHCQPHYYHHQKWYTCMNCGYEEPWVWEPDCVCRHEIVDTVAGPLGRVLIERYSWCKVHGKDFSNSWPVSLRDTPGKYGTKAGPTDRSGIVKGLELQRTMSRKKVRFMEDLK